MMLIGLEVTSEEKPVIYFKYYNGVEGLKKIRNMLVWKVDVRAESRFEPGTHRIKARNVTA
jgi:hypothetical protein